MVAGLALVLLAQSPLASESLRPEGGPELRVHRHPGPLVALRLSVPVPPDLPEGVAELAQELARPGAERRAHRLGAALELRREAGHAVIRVAGPADALDELVALLRHATAAPDLASASLSSARARSGDRVLAGLEQPASRLRRILAHQLGRAPPVAGFTARSLEPEAIRAAVRRLYAPDAMRVVVVGDVPLEVLRSAFGRWPAVPPGSGLEPPAPVPPPRPQAVGSSAALAYPLDVDAATAAVAAALVERRFRRSALRWGGAEAWRGRDGPVLVVVGGAAPDDATVTAAAAASELPGRAGARPASATAPYLRRLIAEARALASVAAVEAAALELRRSLLLEARTPAGRAEVIGRLADVDADADAFLADLSAVDAGAVLRALDAALAMAPVLAEIAP